MSATGPQVVGLHHVQIACPPDAEDSLRAFYAGLLGMAEIPKPARLAARGGCWFAVGDGRELHCGVEPAFRPARKAHPCFMVDDLDAAARVLRRAGHDVRPDAEIGGVRRFHTDDPVGNRVEIQQVAD